MIIPATLLSLAAMHANLVPKTHSECTALVEQDAQRGLGYAEQWVSHGGGSPAQHCVALAHLANDAPLRAAHILLLLAESESADLGVSSRLYIQSAEAFMTAGKKLKSFAALRKAYEKTPNAPELHMAAATIYATGEEWEGVVLTITALARTLPLSADALALRARGYYHRQEYQQAAKDVSAALAQNPVMVDALVLRGDLKALGVSLEEDPYAP